MRINSGTYVGTGSDGLAITGVGFQADLVLIKNMPSTDDVFFKTSSHPTTFSSHTRHDFADASNAIKSLDADGFTLGTLSNVNTNGNTHVWMAFKKDSANDFNVGTYTGTGVDGLAVTGVGFQPNFLLTKSNSTITGGMKFAGNSLTSMMFTGADRSDLIVSLDSDGFTLNDGSASGGNCVNVNATAHYWFAFKEGPSATVFTYTGNGADNRLITAPFSPQLVIVKDTTSTSAAVKMAVMSAEMSFAFDAAIDINKIQTITPWGFVVGSNVDVNTNTDTIYALVVGKAPSAGTAIYKRQGFQ